MNGSDRASTPVRSLSALVLVFTGCASDVPASTAIDVAIAASGSVNVTLHPGPAAVIGSTGVVSFGIPFPRMALRDTGLLRAFDDDGVELPIHVRETLRWRAWPGAGTRESIRAAVVSIEIRLDDRSPHRIRLEYGAAPSVTMGAPADPLASWVAVTDGEFPAGTVKEPRVYASVPTWWLSRCLLRGHVQRIGAQPAMSWFDDFMVGAAHTAVNDVPPEVTERINYTTDYEPWLFDRTATLFGVYARTGDVQWLRHAHRSAQFYRAHIDAAGYFDLKGDDLKYSYGRSLLIDYMFTGDAADIAAIRRVASAGDSWDPTYELDTSFWTERHQTYAFLAALSAWEATGEAAYADRAQTIADISFDMAADPLGSWHADGCMLHGMTAHEGAGGNVPICSPWMSALFADAVSEYYLHSRDQRALTFLAGLGHYVREYGLYGGGEGLDVDMPWYLSSSVKTFSDEGPWGDIEHTCDVAGLVARGAWAERELGRDTTALEQTLDTLLISCEENLSMWHRPGSESVGKAEWRLSPPRKFNWWFGTTSDLTWIMAALR